MTMRKWLNLFENENSINIEKIYEIYLYHFRSKHSEVIIDPATGRISVDGDVNCQTHWKASILPVTFNEVQGSFHCDNRGLETLENCPTSVDGDFYCDLNRFVSLKYLPQGNIQRLTIANNNPILENFEGIELDSNIQEIYATYALEIPLLRLLVAKVEIDFSNSLNEQANQVQDILNHHIKAYSNLKERIIKCQYALIKAGFKDNAKW